MDGLLRLLVMLVGVALILLALADVYLTVLYARMGAAIISHRLACWTWYAFKFAARYAGRFRDTLLSYCGPTVLVLLV
jgi:hypothetical protein